MPRELQFNVRFDEEETAMLERLASHYGMTGAGVVRLLLRERARELFGAEKTRKPKRRS